MAKAKTTNAAIAIEAAGRRAIEKLELDGMPERQIVQTVRYVIERTEFVDGGDRLDVGDRRSLPDGASIEFEIVSVTHTIKDGNDVYVAKAVEVV